MKIPQFPLIVMLACAAASTASPADAPRSPDFLEYASLGVKTLQGWYAPSTGLWTTTNWWNAANAVTVLVSYSRLSGDSEYRQAVANTFDRNSGKAFLNDYYDDEGWWALAWISAYDWTHDSRYLDAARRIFDDMAQGWDDVCGGGIWWKKDRHYKNAIANELFLSVAANLARETAGTGQQGAYLDWARREWEWFSASGMINSQNLVNDGLDASCHNNGRTTWSYNQGVILGGLSALAPQMDDSTLLPQAQAIARAAISKLTDSQGILHEPCEPKCGADGVQFKGIFARNVAILNAAAPLPEWRNFLRTNAESIWEKARGPNNQLGLVWSGPFDSGNAAAQTSALDALVGAAAVSAKPDRPEPRRRDGR